MNTVATTTATPVNQAQVQEFVDFVQNLVNAYTTKMGFTRTRIYLHTMGSRYAKIARDCGQVGVYGFIDLTNGDILMSATWKAPAKHARGSLHNKKSWTCAGPYGIAYLR